MFLHYLSNALRSLQPASSVPPETDRGNPAVNCFVRLCSHHEAAPHPWAPTVPPGCVGGITGWPGSAAAISQNLPYIMGSSNSRAGCLKDSRNWAPYKEFMTTVKMPECSLFAVGKLKKNKLGVSRDSRSTAMQPNRLLELFSWKSQLHCFGQLYWS